jgi:hypothetical protein
MTADCSGERGRKYLSKLLERSAVLEKFFVKYYWKLHSYANAMR